MLAGQSSPPGHLDQRPLVDPSADTIQGPLAVTNQWASSILNPLVDGLA
jgi:hypothetical protein